MIYIYMYIYIYLYLMFLNFNVNLFHHSIAAPGDGPSDVHPSTGKTAASPALQKPGQPEAPVQTPTPRRFLQSPSSIETISSQAGTSSNDPSKLRSVETEKTDQTVPVVQPEPQSKSAPTAQQPEAKREIKPDPSRDYEVGWSEEHMCGYRKEILGVKLRGPIEFSATPKIDHSVDSDAAIECVFKDGHRVQIPHITMAS